MVWHGLVRSCATAQFGYCRLSNRRSSPYRSFTKPKIRAQHGQISLLHAMWSKPDCLISVITCWTFNCVFFRTVSQKRFFFPHGDSHPLDVGLGRAPPVDLPRICSYALAVEKGIHPDAVAPRRPGLRGGAESEPHFASAFPPQEQHP